MAGATEAFVRLRGKIPSTPTCSFGQFTNVIMDSCTTKYTCVYSIVHQTDGGH